ncbi:hemolysin family protein [Paenibacillus protaetiae]|uniref:HlyC/CorC family transporter n=1 Tax=Paenibacillus protaetiae TaxID=2509456 RepID=A0A4P6EUC2_9BACL|nr:hemolysin family protein [Paenibacillus protaetiae]QAY65703.1 HlyC/CorC family transporter [Paenibacillus protaetiae]
MVWKLIVFVVLIFFTAFFVATEFALVRLRASRVQQMVQESRKNAKAVQTLVGHLDSYLSATQLGITIMSLGIGWLGEPTVSALLEPLFKRIGLEGGAAHAVSFIISFVIVTYLEVVLGELAPKTVAILKAEQIAQLTAPVMIGFHKLMYPFIWLLNGSSNKLVGLFGMKPAKEHEAVSEEELRLLLSESYDSGKINRAEYAYVNRIFDFDERLAKEIMVPRTDMICLYTNKTKEENIEIVLKEKYTRFPVAKGSKDNIIGIVNTKQFFFHYAKHGSVDVRSLLQPAVTVPEVTPIKVLLRKMQLEQVHLAILLDEYGGTAGLVTIEDILEEIVGEIRDEFDGDEARPFEKLDEGFYRMDGKVLLSNLYKWTGIDLKEEEVDTIGGWLASRNPGLDVHEEWQYGPYTFVVLEKDQLRIRRLEVIVN